MMQTSDYLAGYAAFVATGGFGWQIWTVRRARRPDVTVTVAFVMLAFGPEVVDYVAVTVANLGDRPLGVNGVGLYLQDASRRTMVKPTREAMDTLPGTIAPHHSGQMFFRRDNVEDQGFALTTHMKGFANLATGGTVDSKPTRLLKPS